MKTVQFRKRNLVFYSALATIGIVVLSSCLKSVDTTPPKKQTYISLLHLAPAAPAVDVYLNSTKSTATPIPSGSFFSRYSALDVNYYAISFKKGGGDSVVAALPADIYDSLEYATLLLYNSPFGSGVEAERINDDFSTFSNSLSNIRFFHVSPGLMAVDVYFDNTVITSSRQYVDNVINPSFNLFTTRDPGFYTISVKKAGSDSLIAQTSTTLQQAQAYTILLSGVPGAVGDHAIAVDVLQASN
jgi:hypothetical protein